MTANAELNNIVQQCRKGSEQAWSVLVDMFSGKLYVYFFRLTGNAEIANDLLSELFLKVVKKIKSFKQGSFESWIYRIASNLFYDYLRQKQRKAKLDKHLKENPDEQIIEPVQFDDESDKMQQAINTLDQDGKEIVLMHYYSDMTFKDIAEVKGQPIGTVLSKAHRSLKKLRQLMEDKNG